ncbi:MAG: cell division protein FtsZ [Alphaproteobacteria bacterium]
MSGEFVMINISLPEHQHDLQPKLTVVGVGGAGGNAVNNMIKSSLEGVEFLVCNTDAQALVHSTAPRRIQLGPHITKGLGAGARPDIGRAAAEEAMEEILACLDGSNMVFITAGMGGGTGTGAAPVIARTAKEQNILTVGVVTKPFHFEGAHRMRLAEQGIQELQQYVDTLIVIPNQNLFRIANEKTTFADAFKMADDVLYSGVRGVTDLMVMPGLINLDFADIRTVMSEMGKAMMGTGEAEGDRRAILAAEAAISNPLLDEVSLKGARAMLINITAGMDVSLFEVDEAVNRVRAEVDPDCNVIFGSTFDPGMEGKMRVSVVATGIESALQQARLAQAASGDAASGQFQPLGNNPPINQSAGRRPVNIQTNMQAQGIIQPTSPRQANPSAQVQHDPYAVSYEGQPLRKDMPIQQSVARNQHVDQSARNAAYVAQSSRSTAAQQQEDQGNAQRYRSRSLFERVTNVARRVTNEVQPTTQHGQRASYAQAPASSANNLAAGDYHPNAQRQQPVYSEPPQANTAPAVPAAQSQANTAPQGFVQQSSTPATDSPRGVIPQENMAKPRQVTASEDEMLEIPAFLRRQAN